MSTTVKKEVLPKMRWRYAKRGKKGPLQPRSATVSKK